MTLYCVTEVEFIVFSTSSLLSLLEFNDVGLEFCQPWSCPQFTIKDCCSFTLYYVVEVVFIVLSISSLLWDGIH